MSGCLVDQQITIENCTNQAQWDEYVARNPKAVNYHRWLWGDIIQKTYGHSTYRLCAQVAGQIQGILPLTLVRSRLFGKCLVSVPFFSYGGVLAEDAATANLLLTRAVEMAREVSARHIELRGSQFDTSWVAQSHKVTMQVALPATTDELWNRMSSGIRNKIRNARKHGLRVEWTGIEGVGTFYEIFARNMRDLGTPVYPKSWFENIVGGNPDDSRFLLIWDGQQAVAAGIAICHGSIIEWPWSASLLESRKKYSAVLMYWSLLEWGVQNGYKTADLGRCTPGSGTHEFKRHFGCQELSLDWYYWTAPGVSPPQLRNDNPKYRLATRMWQKLPLAVANRLGPKIVRGIP